VSRRKKENISIVIIVIEGKMKIYYSVAVIFLLTESLLKRGEEIRTLPSGSGQLKCLRPSICHRNG